MVRKVEVGPGRAEAVAMSSDIRENRNERLAIGVRFFGKKETREADLTRLAGYLDAALLTGGTVFAAINIENDETNAVEYVTEHYGDMVRVLTPTPWVKFVPALNAIVSAASESGATELLFASTECPPHLTSIDKLRAHMDEQTLMAGARMIDHAFEQGAEGAEVTLQGNGGNMPWNVYALWNLPMLASTGFPLIADGAIDPKTGKVDRSIAGVEEVSTAAVQQALYGAENRKIKLVDTGEFPVIQDMTGWDESRMVAHQKKIASKVARPAKQLEYAGLGAPVVIHVSAE